MNFHRSIALGFVLASSLATVSVAQSGPATSTVANATPTPVAIAEPAPAAATTAALTEVAALEPAMNRQAMAIPPAPVDGLRTDSRWPSMKNCIENTATPSEFRSCLQEAFLTDTTGQSAQLLGSNN